MPRYYFDLKTGNSVAVDEEGVDLSDLEAAQSEAAQSLGAMARDAAVTGKGTEQMEISVRDDDGPVMTVRFSYDISRKKTN
ncbi:DUF6894 family protein [Bradyrhizobium australafricanum]|uniref:DUF6894 family protein n=1 Tax=Bradyrhizobium australafricanum TaxID=2821406 RepID=UPI001CE2E79D|nr:hypothetical protein [Bradyrhizobium australafricanum]MCA6105379.1 hypothetical protein [Bradyrhizobium australafricanum]